MTTSRPHFPRTALGVAAFVLALPCLAQQTAEDLLRQIDTEGSRSVLNQLWDNGEAFDHVCDMIELADAKWLEVARRLRPASDAGASLSLDYSVARALPRAPERVLALIGNGFAIQNICTSPFIEPEPGVAEEYQRRTAAALRRIRTANLSAIAIECLNRVEVPLVARSR